MAVGKRRKGYPRSEAERRGRHSRRYGKKVLCLVGARDYERDENKRKR